MKTTPLSCNLDCGAGCPLLAHVENGKLIRVTNNPARGRYMRGCAKGFRTPDLLYHHDRLTRPLVRIVPKGQISNNESTAAGFREASWDEALSLAAEKLLEAREHFGPASILQIGGSGSCRGALHNTALLLPRFLALFGGYTETTGSYSSQAVDFLNPYLFGTREIGIDVRNLLSSQYIILWGFNPADTRFGCETEAVFQELKRRGTPILAIDPRRTRTIDLCGAQWLPILPGSDAALASALIWLFLDGGRVDLEQMDRLSIGFSEIVNYITGITDGIAKIPEWAEKQCGIASEQIIQLYRRLAASRPAAILPGLSVQRILGGEDTNRLLAMLQLAAGNTGKIGGSAGAGQWNKVPKPRCGRLPVPPNPAESCVPVNSWADAVLSGSGDSSRLQEHVSLIYSVGGNYAVQSSDSEKVRTALMSANTVISHEFFLTPTAELSDIIFPAAMFPERTDICFTNSGLLLYSRQAVPPAGSVKTDYEIFSLLADKLGFGDAFTGGKDERQHLQDFLSESEVDDPEEFMRTGIWEGESRPFNGLQEFVANPLKHPLATPSGRIELVSEIYAAAGGSRVPRCPESVTSQRYPLRLITPHEKYRVHSQHTNVEKLARLCDNRLLMHPLDAGERGIAEGDLVKVKSASGEISLTVRLSPDIVQGAVSLNSGVWKKTAFADGTHYPGTNTLTDTVPTLPSNGSRTHTNAVEVTRIR
jgi:molybdopterin guanine dinucleotide-containing S/N-oxide reductase-like protein